MKVSNKKIIRSLSLRSMKAGKARNVIAVLAIALTTILFTALFTITFSIGDNMQQSSFREAGGYWHGSFKNLTEKQLNTLKQDKLIKKYGKRLLVGNPDTAPFVKDYVEVAYSDKADLKQSFSLPIKGHLPKEGTNEAIADTHVLALLGVKPKIGQHFAMTINEDGQEREEKFVLSGWWKPNKETMAYFVNIRRSRAEQIIAELKPIKNQSGIGTWALKIMLADSRNIKQDLKRILKNHGFQNDSQAKKNYIGIGVNWAYIGAQASNNQDSGMVFAGVALVLIIVLTGYLIIYNIFKISVINDIHLYGLLKTIGTTAKQLKRMIRLQALTLCLFGIPLGLLTGYGVGVKLTPIIIAKATSMQSTNHFFNPWVFVIAGVFALVTVLISCHKPGKIAAKISPVEAVHYTEKINFKKKFRKSKKGTSLIKMAWFNLWRSPGKTILTILSLSLAVVLLNLTVVLANGVDMQKALRKMPEDFILQNANGLVIGRNWTTEDVLTENMIKPVEEQKEITSSGRTYVSLNPVLATQKESFERDGWKKWDSPKQLNQRIAHTARQSNGDLLVKSSLQGMNDYGLDKCEVIKGDINKLRKPGKYIAAVYSRDDYFKLETDTHWAKLGDKVTIRYADEYEHIDPYTGKVNTTDKDDQAVKATKYHDVEYKVAALVTYAYSLSAREDNPFIINDQTLIRDAGPSGSGIQYYAFDTKEKDSLKLEHYLKDYTETKQPKLGYDSQILVRDTWKSTKQLFMMLGGVLSLIIGIVGVLNFFNAELTGILARKREFAIEQSIGMTGKQLKRMLVTEGVFYAVSTILISLLISTTLAPVFGSAVSKMFWFFTYHIAFWPILAAAPIFILLGVIIPLISYHYIAKHSIVERLREAA